MQLHFSSSLEFEMLATLITSVYTYTHGNANIIMWHIPLASIACNHGKTDRLASHLMKSHPACTTSAWLQWHMASLLP